MMRVTFVYPGAPVNGLATITNEFGDEHFALAKRLEAEMPELSFYDRCFEADDLIDFERICVES